MVDARSGPMMYKVQVAEVVLNNLVDHMKAANLQMGQEQNIPNPSEHLEKLLEPVGSTLLPSTEETSESEMDAADVAALCLYHLKKDPWLTDINRRVRGSAHPESWLLGSWISVKVSPHGNGIPASGSYFR
eukprot:g23564.t1